MAGSNMPYTWRFHYILLEPVSLIDSYEDNLSTKDAIHNLKHL